jgi:hypothetical protein
MSSRPPSGSATLDVRHAEQLLPNSPSCGNQPAYISLDRASPTTRSPHRRSDEAEAPAGPTSRGRLTLPLDKLHYISAGGIIYGDGHGSATSTKFTGKITGGTGAYKGIKGTIKGTSTGKNGDDEQLVFTYHH